MEPQTPTAPFEERRKNIRRPEGPAWKWFLIIVTLLLIAGFVQAHPPQFLGIPYMRLYKPGDNLGYNIGLVGGLMMLVMLLYPLRKRFKFMKDRGLLPTWFRWHMVLGIMGPALIMFHSTFIIRSINAGVALVCMMLVSGSGIFGRFFYTKIHNGLYGRQRTLKTVHDDMTKTGNFRRSISGFAPDIERRMEEFRVRAEDEEKKGGFLNFILIGIEAASLSKTLSRELHQQMYAQAQEHNWDSGAIKRDVDKLYQEYNTHVTTYIKTLCDTAQFHTYERLFSLWHIFHIPLVYMLIFSGIYHVISVHMY